MSGSGPVDLTRGTSLFIRYTQERHPDLATAFGLYFDPTTWNGLDLFKLPNRRDSIITRRVAEHLLSKNLIGTMIVPVLEYGRSLAESTAKLQHDTLTRSHERRIDIPNPFEP